MILAEKTCNALPKAEGTGRDIQYSYDVIKILNLCDKLLQKYNDSFISSDIFILVAIESYSILGDLLKR